MLDTENSQTDGEPLPAKSSMSASKRENGCVREQHLKGEASATKVSKTGLLPT